jgi:hypothetical protein
MDIKFGFQSACIDHCKFVKKPLEKLENVETSRKIKRFRKKLKGATKKNSQL